VVGSSDILRLHGLLHGGTGGLGPEIDAHEMVLRINHAPTVGYEQLVGNRTSFRLVNHVLLEWWLRPQAEREREFGTDLCSTRTGDVDLGCFYKDRAARLRLLSRYQSRGEGGRTLPTGAAMLGLEDVCTRALSHGPMSGGFLGVLLAAQSSCALPIDVYGFYPFCCHVEPFPSMRYKYYHGEATRWVCCSTGREPMDEEYALFEILEAHGWVRLHAMPPHKEIKPQCSAVPRWPKEHELFAVRPDVATDLADFDCAELSIDRTPCVCRVCLAAAPWLCDRLSDSCVGFEVSAGSPRIATLKGTGAGLLPRKGVTWHEMRRSSSRAQQAYSVRRDSTIADHDMPCARGITTRVPSEARACVVCPGVAGRICSQVAECAGYAVNKEGLYATLKTGPIALTRAPRSTTFLQSL
jgi:hypothetical protein